MFYNRMLGKFILDPLDYFLMSAIVGSLGASWLKNYLSEKNAAERLRKSVIKKSKIIEESPKSITSSKEIRLQRICAVALRRYGGQQEQEPETALELAKIIETIVENLAKFLKKHEINGVGRIFFKSGRIILDLILNQCQIRIRYAIAGNDPLDPKIIILTIVSGGVSGFITSWLSAGVALGTTPTLFLALIFRSVNQQIINLREYANFKNMFNKVLKEKEIKETMEAFLSEVNARDNIKPNNLKSTSIQLQSQELIKNPLADFTFDSTQSFDEFLKKRMKDEFGLIPNPTSAQIQSIVKNRKYKVRPKAKIVYFSDFIEDLKDTSTGIVDVEIITEIPGIRIRNEEL